MERASTRRSARSGAVRRQLVERLKVLPTRQQLEKQHGLFDCGDHPIPEY